MDDFHANLMAAAQPVPDAAADVFARIFAARLATGEIGSLGLTSADVAQIFRKHFPNAVVPAPAGFMSAVLPLPMGDFVRALQGLLLEHARPDDQDARWLACIIAHAGLRPDHLWRDLGLSGRDDVTAMLERHFAWLAARNTGNLRWKKFFAYTLAAKQGVVPAPSPGCPGCEDFTVCYSPEERQRRLRIRP